MDIESARNKVSGPGTALQIIGVLGILAGLAELGWGAVTVVLAVMNDTSSDVLMAEASSLASTIIFGLFGFVASAIVIMGGGRMKRLHSHSFAMAASVIAMFPCCVGSCCIAGLPVGIWAIVTLMNDEVKQAFAQVAVDGA